MPDSRSAAGFSSRSVSFSPGELVDSAISSYTVRPADSPVDTVKFRSLLAGMLSSLSQHLPSFTPVSLCLLSAGMRSVVLRVSSPDSSVILKHFRRRDSATNSGGFGYLREKHGLVALNSLVPGSYSSLLFSDDSARLLCLEDVAGTPLLALGSTRFEGQDGALAASAVSAWICFWAGLLSSDSQGISSPVLADFSARIAAADPRAHSPGSLTSPALALKGLHRLAADEGVSEDSAEFAHWVAQVESVLSPPPASLVLTSGDFSPHNLLTHRGRVRGFDAEGTSLHHRFLPLAEFLLGFPSAPLYPAYTSHFSEKEWLAWAQDFYERISPTPVSNLLNDPQVNAAVLTVRAILAEQTGR